jgi:glutathione S-transferase
MTGADTPLITVYHLEQSRSHRVLWMLEELEVPYRLVRYRRDPKTFRADPALRQVHPLGKAPIVSLPGEVVLYESGAILEHLAENVGGGRFRPEPGTPACREYRALMHFAEGSMMPSLLVRLIFDRLRDAPLPFFVKPIAKRIAGNVDALFTQPEIDLHMGFLEELLGSKEHFIGTFSAADIQLSYPVEAAFARGRVGAQAYPGLRRWMQRMKSRPAYDRAVAKGGPAIGT